MNLNLQTALNDLREGIESVTLGSIESVVIHAASRELIMNWNDHCESLDLVNSQAALKEWEVISKWNSSPGRRQLSN